MTDEATGSETTGTPETPATDTPPKDTPAKEKDTAAATPPSEAAAPTSSEAPAPPVAPEHEPPQARKSDGCFLAVGRRKSAVARIRIRPGEGRFLVNGRDVDEYFSSREAGAHAKAALTATSRDGSYDVLVRVHGGGMSGQSGAILMGIARALKDAEPALEESLRKDGFLTRDARMKERKKYGRRGARRSFQFSKR